VGAWGPGVYQNDDALDLRDRWRALRSVGFDAGDVGRRLVDEMGLGDDPDQAASWLALADLLRSAGRLAGEVRKRALRITRDGVDLQRWERSVPVGQSWTGLVVVDALSWSGEPAVVCEILDWHRQNDPSPADLRDADVHRTADTVQVVRSRVVDPRNRHSVANMKRHLGVRDPNERAPVRVCLVGICPDGVAVVGQRRVVVPTSGSNAIEWKHLGKIVEGLMRA
jgi:hypothetical protein